MIATQRFARKRYLMAAVLPAALILGLLLAVLPSAAAPPAAAPSAAAPPAAAPPAAAPPVDVELEVRAETIISLQAPEEVIQVGDELTVTVRLSDVIDLYAIDIQLSFSPTQLRVVDADPGLPGIQITPADCPVPDYVHAQSADNTLGIVSYIATQFYPSPPISGDCSVAHIRMNPLKSGSTLLHFELALLSDLDANTIPATMQDRQLKIKAAPTFTSVPITMAVQGTPYTYTVTAEDEDGSALTFSAPTLPSWLSLTDHGDDTATLSGIPANADVGDHPVVLRVTDSDGLSDSQTFTITVWCRVYLPVVLKNPA